MATASLQLGQASRHLTAEISPRRSTSSISPIHQKGAIYSLMAIILEAAYSKKLGLPHYSSHSYVVSLRTELSDLTQVEGESARLYTLLQRSVDTQIRNVGYLPGADTPDQPDGHTSASNPHPINEQPGDGWTCSDKQRNLILKLIEQHGLDKAQVEALAKEMFGLPVKTLNRLQASGLIEELLERHGRAEGKNGHDGRANGAAAYRRHTARP